jgi:hypothetical protein
MSSQKRLNLVKRSGLSPDVCLLSMAATASCSLPRGVATAREGMDITRWREDGTRLLGPILCVRNLDEGVWSAGVGLSGETPTVQGGSAPRPGDHPPSRRRRGDLLRGRGRSRRRRGSPSRHPDQPRRQAPHAGGDELCRGGPQSAPSGPGTPGLRQALPGDRIPCVAARPALPPPAARPRSAADLGSPGSGERGGGGGRVRDRPRSLPGTRALREEPGGDGRRRALSGTVGPVLDPVFSLRQRSGGRGVPVLAFTTAAPEDRDQALALAARFGSLETVDRIFEETTASEAARQAELGLAPDAAALFQRLAAHVLFASSSLRSRQSVAQNRLGQPGLWPHGISGDVPIALLRIGADRNVTGTRGPGRTRTGAARPRSGPDHSARPRPWYGRRTAPPARGPSATRPLQNWSTGRARVPRRVPHVGGRRDTARGGRPSPPPAGVMARCPCSLAAGGDRSPLPPPLLPLSDRVQEALKGSPAAVWSCFSTMVLGVHADGRDSYHLARRRATAGAVDQRARHPDFGCLVTEAGGGYTGRAIAR